MSSAGSLCAMCARRGRTCCQLRELYVSPGDVVRIAAFTGESEFFEFRAPGNREYLDQDEDLLWKHGVFRSDGSRRVLRQTESGDCCFLSSAGCRLPLEVRPLVCRLHPLQYSATDLRNELVPGCPVDLLPPGESVLHALGMTRRQAETWRAQLYEEIQQEEHYRCTWV